MLREFVDVAASCVAVIGGGGKTGFIDLLSRGLTEAGKKVVVSATTRLGRWQFPGLEVLESSSLDAAHEFVGRVCAGRRVLLMGADSDNSQKYAGLPPAWFASLTKNFPDVQFLVEADGSRGLPIKAHRKGEPLLPDCAHFLVAVIGLSGLFKPFAESVHRPEIFETALGRAFAPNEILRPEDVAEFLKSRWAGFRPDLLFLNQADTALSLAAGETLAKLLPPELFPKIVAGSLHRKTSKLMERYI